MYYDKRTEVVEAPAPVKLEPWQQVLLEAAQYIREHGWCQHTSRIGPRACLMGAINSISWQGQDRARAITEIAAETAKLSNDDPAGWNDRPKRTKEEVIALIERVARAG